MDKTFLGMCPFCGSGAAVSVDMFNKWYEVICHGCGARTAPCLYGRKKKPIGGKKYKTDDEARAAAILLWNTRKKGLNS